MREAKLVSVILVAALLLFGCGAPAQQNQTNQTPPAQPPAQTPPSQPPSTPPAEPPPGGAPNGSMNGTSGGTTDSFEGKDWAGLIALGVPAQCDVTSSGSTTKMYMVEQGKKVRVESSSDTCTKTVTIIKDKTMYLGCAEGEPMFPGCDWVLFDLSGGETTSGSAGTGSPSTTYESAPSSSFECEAWLPDASMFETPGNICNLQDMYGGQ